jgi:DNA-binding transcriptional MerR regulator
MFNEKTLREEIIKTWGAHGAHVEVFDAILEKNKTLQDERDLYKDSCSNISTNSINLEKKLREQISTLNNKITDLKKENEMLEKVASRAQDHAEDLLQKSMPNESQNDLWTDVNRVIDDNTRSLGTKIAYLMSKFTLKRK